MKSEVEGSEMGVVGGDARLLETRHPTLLIEFHGPDDTPATDLLRSYGYAMERLPLSGEVVFRHPETTR